MTGSTLVKVNTLKEILLRLMRHVLSFPKTVAGHGSDKWRMRCTTTSTGLMLLILAKTNQQETWNRRSSGDGQTEFSILIQTVNFTITSYEAPRERTRVNYVYCLAFTLRSVTNYFKLLLCCFFPKFYYLYFLVQTKGFKPVLQSLIFHHEQSLSQVTKTKKDICVQREFQPQLET